MKEQPKTVVCTSCSAKFLVPDELIRGKLVKFRCRKCGSAMEVDGRKSARPPPAPELPPPPPEPPGVDTPATFSQRTLPPPPRPPTTLPGGPSLHAWPEPPRSRSTTAPTSLYESSPPELSLPRLETVRDPSNRGAKIAAMVALLVAAGLSGVGLAMRGSPPGAASPGEASDLEGLSRPYIPPGASEPARSRAETWGDNANRSNRNPTRVTDLPRAAPPEQATAAGLAAASKPSEAATEKHEPPALREAAHGAPVVGIANSEGQAPGAADDLSASAHADPTAQENSAAAAVPVAAGNEPAEPNAAAAAANPGSALTPPAPAARAKGDFNTQAAREALQDAADRAAKCKTIDTPSGNARVAVTFAPNGHVTTAVIDSGAIVGTAAGTCVASKFRAARVPPFSGEAVLVRKNVRF